MDFFNWKTFQIIIIIAFLITCIIFAVNYCTKLNKLVSANDRIEQLEKINKILDKRQDTAIDKESTSSVTQSVTTSVNEDYLEFIEDYNIAQKTYIELLQGLLKNNGVQYPDFMFEKLLEEAIK